MTTDTSDDFDQWWAEKQARIAAADWHDVPRGHYAILVFDDDFDRLLGYKLFERKTPRTFKNGRTVGRDGWRRSYALAPGIIPSRAAFDELYKHAFDGTEYQRKSDIIEILDNLEYARAEFGKLTGRCGCCGKTLTDPDSKMRGIGPECIKGVRR